MSWIQEAGTGLAVSLLAAAVVALWRVLRKVLQKYSEDAKLMAQAMTESNIRTTESTTATRENTAAVRELVAALGGGRLRKVTQQNKVAP